MTNFTYDFDDMRSASVAESEKAELASLIRLRAPRKARSASLSAIEYVVFSGEEVHMNIAQFMKKLRIAPPRSFSDIVVRYFYDFKNGFSLDLEKKYAEPLDKQGIDVVSLLLADGNEIHMIPSDAEPEIKVYFLLRGDDHDSLRVLHTGLKTAVLKLIQQYSEV